MERSDTTGDRWNAILHPGRDASDATMPTGPHRGSSTEGGSADLAPLQGVGDSGVTGSGGVAALHHRLQADIPPGWMPSASV